MSIEVEIKNQLRRDLAVIGYRGSNRSEIADMLYAGAEVEFPDENGRPVVVKFATGSTAPGGREYLSWDELKTIFRRSNRG